jgi:hypothetical protein
MLRWRLKCAAMMRRIGWRALGLFVALLCGAMTVWTVSSTFYTHNYLMTPAAQPEIPFGCARLRSVAQCAYDGVRFDADSGFELTLVIAGRNDDYGGANVIRRFQVAPVFVRSFMNLHRANW